MLGRFKLADIQTGPSPVLSGGGGGGHVESMGEEEKIRTALIPVAEIPWQPDQVRNPLNGW